jgi:hypothetical protein
MALATGLFKLFIETPPAPTTACPTWPTASCAAATAAWPTGATYSQAGQRFTAELTIAKHRHLPGVVSALGYNDVAVQLEGWAEECSAEVTGTSRDNLGIRFRARLTMIADQRLAGVAALAA